MSVTERPYKNSYSKNYIRYVFQLANLTRTGLYLQVKIQYADIGSTTFTELSTFELKPDVNGSVYVYIQDYLDSLLKYVLPVINQTVTVADAQAKLFYVEYREISDDNYDPDWNTDESNNIRTVIKGGVEKNKFDRNNIFSKYIETNKVFLTWQPAKHFVFGSDNVYMSYLNLNPAIQQLLKVTCTAVNGTQDIITIPFTGNNFIYHFCVSSLFSQPAFTQKKNYCFDVSVVKVPDASVLLNGYRFLTEYRPVYKKQYELIYFNSLGGVDSVTISGQTDITGSRDYDDTEGGFNLDWTSQVNTHEASYTNIRYQRQFKGDIGFLRNRTKKQQEAFLELFVTTNIYQVIDSRWIPVTGLQKSVALGANTDTKQSFPIEWSLSESNEVFTPEDMKFGAGVNPAVVVTINPPSNLTVVNVSNTNDSNATFDEQTETGRVQGSAWTQKIKISGSPVAGDIFQISVYSNDLESTYTNSIAAIIQDLASKINALNLTAMFHPPDKITAQPDVSDNSILDVTFDYNHSAAASCINLSTKATVTLNFTAATPAPASYTLRITNVDTSETTYKTNFTGTVDVTRGHLYHFAIQSVYDSGVSGWTTDIEVNVQ